MDANATFVALHHIDLGFRRT